MQKIGVIGCGMVGMSYIFAMVHSGMDLELVMLDMNKETLHGNVMDVEDALWLVKSNTTVRAGEYKDLAGADLLVITAGRPQKPGETRPQMIKDNARVMKEIAKSVKDSGFKGITLLASNPVDALTYVYQTETGFPRHRVIGSGTLLDSSRASIALSRKMKVGVHEVDAVVIGEHGDTSAFVGSMTTVKGRPVAELIAEKKITAKDLEEIHMEAVNKAGAIIKAKHATYYGIGTSLSKISKAILRHRRLRGPLGVFVKGIHGVEDIVLSYPVTVDGNGIELVVELPLTDSEKKKFQASAVVMTGYINGLGYKTK